jgi:DNA-binding XRE family transcriptional regulator
MQIMKIHKNAGKSVAKLRKIIGTSQTRFAAMIGVSKHTVISVENGRNLLSQNLAEKIEVATGANLKREKIQSPFNDEDYTRADFARWHTQTHPSTEAVALQQFDLMKSLLKVIFLASAKSGLAGNRYRLPAVSLSFRDWLNETRHSFKLETEMENFLEDETRHLSRHAMPIDSLLEKPTEAEEKLREFEIDFNRIKKQLMEHAVRGWLIVEDEYRAAWTSSGDTYSVRCSTRKLIPRAKCWIKTEPPPPPLPPGPPYNFDQLMEYSAEKLAKLGRLFEEPASQDLLAIPSKKKPKTKSAATQAKR